MTALEMMQALVDEGICKDRAEAIHMLVDAGDISVTQHEALLRRFAPGEGKRIYG